MIQFKKNARTDGRTEVRTDRQKDGQTPFYRTLPATAGVQKNIKLKSGQCSYSLTPENIRKQKKFLMFSGSMERVHWPEMGQHNVPKLYCIVFLVDNQTGILTLGM